MVMLVCQSKIPYVARGTGGARTAQEANCPSHWLAEDHRSQQQFRKNPMTSHKQAHLRPQKSEMPPI